MMPAPNLCFKKSWLVKHLDDGIWELRPTPERILFSWRMEAYWYCSIISTKKREKLPHRRSRQQKGGGKIIWQENRRIQAKEMGTNFRDLWNDPNFISPEQKAKIDLDVALIEKLIEIRKEQGLSQQDLAERCGVKQSAIARLEKMNAAPQVSTLLKVLKPLGYTLAIVPDRWTLYGTGKLTTCVVGFFFSKAVLKFCVNS